jgi:predicted CoA-binding protein
MNGRLLTTDDEIRTTLREARRIAVVGLSPRPTRPSHQVARYLKSVGYHIVPVHPVGGRILGETVYGSLTEANTAVGPFDLVDVFRRPDALPELVIEAGSLRIPVLWFQLGVTHPRAEAAARDLGIDLVVDRCTLVEHRRLLAP